MNATNILSNCPPLVAARQFVLVMLFSISISAKAGVTNDFAGALSDAALVEIKFDQKLNNQVSPNLSFRDENGANVQLGGYFKSKPAILVLGYYGCPMLCGLTLDGMVESLQEMRPGMGNEFEVIYVSIDPQESPALAAAKKRTYLKRYSRKGTESRWHFLTGDDAAIKQLANEVGFRYAYDAYSKQYAHPSGLVILTPDGKVSHYIFGVTYSAKELAADLNEASARKTGSPIEQLILLCFHYRPLTGRYGGLVVTIVRVSGVATLLGLAGVIVFATQRRGFTNQPGKHGAAETSDGSGSSDLSLRPKGRGP